MEKSIEERIKELSPYFIGMNVQQSSDEEGKAETVIYMTAKFSGKWIVPSDILQKYSVGYTPDEENPDVYYFFSDLETGFNGVLDAIEYTVRENRIAEEKAKIFKEKTEELKNLIADERYTVKDLRTLEFHIGGKDAGAEITKCIEQGKPDNPNEDLKVIATTEKKGGKKK